MGTRTLVVTERTDGRFDCRYAHWGVRADPVAQSRPFGRGWTAEAVLAELDAGYDRLLVHAAEPRRYCVCWLDPTLAEFSDIAVARTDDPAALRAWWTALKSRAVDAVADGFGPETARTRLLDSLRRRADAVHLPDDASFLRGGD
jgi:hypothetical protein